MISNRYSYAGAPIRAIKRRATGKGDAEKAASFGDKVGQEPKPMKVRPSPRTVTEAEETVLWLRWLDQLDARPLWLRANRTLWKHRVIGGRTVTSDAP